MISLSLFLPLALNVQIVMIHLFIQVMLIQILENILII